MINAWWWLLLLFLGRLIGLPILSVWFLVGMLAHTNLEGKLPGIVLMGILTDLLMGTLLGMTSFLLLTMAAELTLYREKMGFSTPWSIGLLGVLATAQTVIVWQLSMGFWVYVLAMPLCVVFGLWFSSAGIRSAGKG